MNIALNRSKIQCQGIIRVFGFYVLLFACLAFRTPLLKANTTALSDGSGMFIADNINLFDNDANGHPLTTLSLPITSTSTYDDKIPLFLIHGINRLNAPGDYNQDGSYNGWYNFVSYFQSNSELSSRYKLYIVAYNSNNVSVDQLGSDFAQLLNTLDATSLKNKQIVILAHSMGGLVSRAMMYKSQATGPLWGERVIKLITLATPHHGTPYANSSYTNGPLYRALAAGGEVQRGGADILNNLDNQHVLWAPTWTQYNRSDLLWDNYDNLYNETNLSPSLLTDPAEADCWLKEFNTFTLYNNKLILYAGTYITGNHPPFSDSYSFYGIEVPYNLAEIMADGLALAGDGVVPESSALFQGEGISANATRIVAGGDYDHFQMWRGHNYNNPSANNTSEPLFVRIGQDLVSILPPIFTSFAATPANITQGSAVTISYTVSDNSGSGLSYAQLWRAPDNGGIPGVWSQIGENQIIAGNGPVSNLFTDTPPVGVYWYGVHANNNGGNSGDQQNDGGFSPLQITINQNGSAQLMVVASPANGGIVTGNGSFSVGSNQTITATPASGWTFDQWNDGNTQSSRMVPLTSGGSTYTAIFTQNSSIGPPAVQTVAVLNLTSNSAVLNGTISNSGGSSIDECRFDWGTSTPLTQVISGNSISTSGNSFTAPLTGLTPNTIYYFRAWAHNGSGVNVGYGTGWNAGGILSFTTPPTPTNSSDLDLQSIAVSHNTTYLQSSYIPVANTVKNVGGIASQPYVITFYASTDAAVTSSDYSLGYINRAPVGGGATDPNSTSNAWLPVNLPNGTYYIGAIVTASSDANVSDKVAIDPIPITVGTPPTSTLTITVDPSTTQIADLNQDIAFTVTVRDSNGNPVSGATVTGLNALVSQEWSSSFYYPSTTDVNGQFIYHASIPGNESNGTYNMSFQALKTGYSLSPIIARQVQVSHVNVNATVSVSNVLVAPPERRPGLQATMYAYVNSPGPQSVLLGTTIFPTGTSIAYNDPANDTQVTTSAGTYQLHRAFTVPYGLTSGTYDVQFSVWADANGDGKIDAGDTLLGSATAIGALTIDPAIGTVNVTISPDAAVGAGAEWQIDGSPWHTSGSPIGGIGIGNHLITFNSVPGWSTPASQSVFVSANQTSPVFAAYNVNPITYVVTPSAGANGDVSPETQQPVISGGDVTLSGSANSGFTINQWFVNGNSVQTGGTSYVLTNVLANESVQVTFTPIPLPTYAVTPGAGADGIVNPAIVQTVTSGSSISFGASPQTGYAVNEWLVDGSAVQNGGASYTLNNVQKQHAVQVTFKPNYLQLKGGYLGSIASSGTSLYGRLAITLASNGAFTGTAIINGHSYRILGVFGTTGLFSTTLTARGLLSHTVMLALEVIDGTSNITGTIDGNPVGILLERSIYSNANPAPQAGHYNVILEHPTGSGLPQGDGYGCVTIGRAGILSFVGILGDGTHVSQSTTLTGTGDWPVYIPAYASKGYISGVVSFTGTSPDYVAQGTLNWSKPGAFSTEIELSGARYLTPALSPNVFPDDQLSVSVNDGASIDLNFDTTTNPIHKPNQLYFTGEDNFAVSLTLSTGVFSGHFTDPSHHLRSLSGVIIENQGQGAGFFKSSVGTGYIEFQNAK